MGTCHFQDVNGKIWGIVKNWIESDLKFKYSQEMDTTADFGDRVSMLCKTGTKTMFLEYIRSSASEAYLNKVWPALSCLWLDTYISPY